VKVDNLLGPYFYQYKKLSLPGIGLFTLADNAVLPDDNNAKVKMQIEGISFTGKTGAALDDSLIQYIKAETGKMKALAEADLYSYIATAFQFLNIGKAFYFEGIGTLQKNKDGNYTFTAGTVLPQKTEEIPSRYDPAKKSAFINEDGSGAGANFNSGRLIIALVILLTLGLIGWGGYYLYSKNTGGNNETTQNETKAPAGTQPTTTPAADSTAKKPDSIGVVPKKDSVAIAPAPIKNDSLGRPVSNYKFILESTDRKARALKRYEQLRGITMLKNYNNKVALETKDSLSFKLFTIVSCTTADTARIKELLNAWYYGKKEMKVKIDR
jgi:hypothetical protein